MSILTNTGAVEELSPAMYKGRDVTGQVFPGGLVLGESEFIKTEGKDPIHIWRVECQSCQRIYDTRNYWVVNKNHKGGCGECYGISQRGKNSPHWRGGEHVPGYFIAKVQAKLSRRSKLIDYSLTLNYLDKLWVLQKGLCIYTKLPLTFGNNAEEGTASLDRIDSSGDYVEGNVQFVHKTINKMKWDLTDMEFKNFCVLVAKNLD